MELDEDGFAELFVEAVREFVLGDRSLRMGSIGEPDDLRPGGDPLD